MPVTTPSRALALAAALLCAPLALAADLPVPAGNQPALRIQGSNTIGASLSPALLQALLEQQGYTGIQTSSPGLDELIINATSPDGRSLSFTLASHGSSSGFSALRDGMADMAAASRPARKEEASSLQLDGPGAEHVIAIDGLAVITHPGNPLRALSIEDVAQIFAGKVQDWSEISTFKGPIHIYARDESSGTWDTFKSIVLGSRGLELSNQARRFESSEQLSDLVSRDPQAIGFIALPYVGNSQALAISDGQSSSMQPTPELIASEDYPLSRRLFLYTPPQANAWAEALAAFAESEDGQRIVAEKGFVPQSVLAMEVQPSGSMPENYSELVSQARRLNATFRFAEGSAELDSKALRDIERVAEYLKSHDKLDSRVVLVGFDDPRGKSEHSMLISRLRAIAVQQHLSRAGVLVKDNLGMGDAMPVASNENVDGRIRNRRVEVWVY